MDTAEYGRKQTPAITPEMRETAKQWAGGYLYVVDATYDPQGGVPPHKIKGAFTVDDNGELGEYQANPEYRPSAFEAAQPPESWIDHGTRLAIGGRLRRDRFLLMIGGAVLPVPVSPQGDPLLSEAEHGRCLLAYTAAAVVPPAVRTETTYLPRLLRKLPADASVVVQGSANLRAQVPVTELVTALREAQLLVDDSAGGLYVGPPVWGEESARLAGLVDQATFTAVEQALVRWGKLGQTTPERDQALRLGITAVELLVHGGVSDRDVLAAAAAFRGVEPLHGGERDSVSEAAEAGVRAALLLRSATSPQLPPDMEAGGEMLVYWVYLQHLRTMPWRQRAIVIANRLADVITSWVPAGRRENRRYDLAGPLLSCADDLPQGLLAKVAEHTGANPVGAKPFMLTPQPAELITSDAQAVERIRSVFGTLADPVHVHDIGPAYRVQSGIQPGSVYFVHKLWNTVTVIPDHPRVTDEFRAKYDVFPA